jgi:hypothetical protein
VVQVNPLPQFGIAVHALHTLLLSQVPAPHGVHVPVPSPTEPEAHVAHVWLTLVVQVKPLPQFAIGPLSIVDNVLLATSVCPSVWG